LYSVFLAHHFGAFTTKVVKIASFGFTMFACMRVKVGETPDFCGIFVLFSFRRFVST
jgi:hypothetical protein